MSKECRRCGLSKDIGDFGRHVAMADGHLHVCKACNKIDHQAYYAANKERLLEATRARLLDPEKRQRDKEVHAAWRAANPERVRASRLRAQANASANGTAVRSSDARQARVAAARRPGTIVSLKAVLRRDGRHCYICDAAIAENHVLQYDHVIPLARGGAHAEENIKPSHRECNGWKSDRLLSELDYANRPTTFEERSTYIAKLKTERRSVAMKARMAAMTPEQRAARGAKISAAKKGYKYPPGTYAPHPKGRKQSHEEIERRRAANVAKWLTKTPEEKAAHAARISATKKARGATGNVSNLSKGWTTEVRARAIAKSADMRRGMKVSPETRARQSVSITAAWARRRTK